MKTLVPERSDNFMSYNGQISNSIPSSPSPFLYAGQLYDKTSGLYYLRARWYDPKTAQFLSVNPLVAKTLQPYEYAGDNPVNAGDPSGECGCVSATTAYHTLRAAVLPSEFDMLVTTPLLAYIDLLATELDVLGVFSLAAPGILAISSIALAGLAAVALTNICPA